MSATGRQRAPMSAIHGERGGVQVEHDVAEPVGAERREALLQEGLLRRVEPAAQPALEQMPQRLKALADTLPNGLVGGLRGQPEPAAQHLVVDEALLFGVGGDVELFVQLGGHGQFLVARRRSTRAP